MILMHYFFLHLSLYFSTFIYIIYICIFYVLLSFTIYILFTSVLWCFYSDGATTTYFISSSSIKYFRYMNTYHDSEKFIH